MTQQAVRAEIVGEALALIFRRRVQQPHQQEERHHRRHEVGIGHLPGTTVTAAAAFAFFEFPDDDDPASGALFVPLTRHLTRCLSCAGGPRRAPVFKRAIPPADTSPVSRAACLQMYSSATGEYRKRHTRPP